MSSIDMICRESTVRPILPISDLEVSSTSSASFWRSVTISSTVIEPMMERRWPAKIRAVSVDIWSWSDRKRWPALTMLSVSLPTLNAITARTVTEMPCLVTQVSATSASSIARVKNRTLRKTGSTNPPCPVTTRKGAPPCPRRPPETSIAWSGAGVRATAWSQSLPAPYTSEPGGTRSPSVSSAAAPIMLCSPTTTPFINTAPIPINTSSSTAHPCRIARWPTVT